MTTEERRRKLIGDIVLKYEQYRLDEQANKNKGRISNDTLRMRIKFLNDEESRFLKEAKTASGRELTKLRKKIFSR